MLTSYPRELGHRGPLVCHHVWDRAIQSACERYHHKYSLFLEDLAAQDMPPGEVHRLWCTSFFTAVGCSLHDVHNGFKHSIIQFVQDPAVMRSTWIALESARSSLHLFS
eukprot:286313-Pyramimonas_sp.AAC.1